MKPELLSVLRCPKCKGSELTAQVQEVKDETIVAGHVECLCCGMLYEIQDGIPIFLVPETVLQHKGSVQKLAQIAYFDRECTEEFEIRRPHDCGRLYDFLLRWKFHNSVRNLPFSLQGKKVLDICCGSGMFSEFTAGLQAKVVGLDISFQAAQRAVQRSRMYGFDAEFVVGDSENLPFRELGFDMVTVHDGLHHLEEPRAGIAEMCRVARESVIIIEAAAAAVTRLAMAVGISQVYEDPGNYIYRFPPGDISSWLEQLGFRVTNLERYFMYYPHQPGTVFRTLDSVLLFTIARWGFLAANALVAHLGNKLQVVGLRNTA